jgi:hypothetical protein
MADWPPHRSSGGANLDDPRLSELYDLSKAAREMRSQLATSLQQAQIEHKYGSLKESMRRSRFFVRHVLTFRRQPTKYMICVAQLFARAKSSILEPLALLDPLFPPVHPFLGYVSV